MMFGSFNASHIASFIAPTTRGAALRRQDKPVGYLNQPFTWPGNLNK